MSSSKRSRAQVGLQVLSSLTSHHGRLMNGKDRNDSGQEVEVPGWQYAVSSGILGWVLDAFDFFVVIFLVETLAANFHVEKRAIVWTISISLAMRPIGALIFGALADRFGRRRPLVACVLHFSGVTALSAFAPSYPVFVVLRALYGITGG